MSSDGVLILSHCGFSFAEDLIAAIKARGLLPFVLSSRPVPEHGEQRLQTLRDHAAAVFATDSHVLRMEDVEDAVASLRAAGQTVLACISVWEGYRPLMAEANSRLGVSDLSAQRIEFLRDKHAVRNALHHAGLSRVTARRVTPAVLDELRRDAQAWFIKPVRGIASYGAFRLSPDTTWATLEAIGEHARADTVYASALGEHVEFIAEGYLAGTEFSFELLVSHGKPFVLGVHEKCELTEANGTVLEDSCTSPPASLAAGDLASGLDWLRAVFEQLELGSGCFHVEARFDGARWDLIEINPRVGGSLISHSVKALNEEAGMLELWLDLLLEQSGGTQHRAFAERLQRLAYTADGTPPSELATFFRVYFATPGEIERIETRTDGRRPLIAQILLKPGDVVPATPREAFLGQLLWRMTRAERDAALPDLLAASVTALDVHYRTTTPALET
ncbi:ATP-grasp domain-containing protein [Paraburkholderia sp. 22099]|jgi:hypothetical protein|uniref:ATP-grasp domain-containing protein n=1 Tax=Paraburkholderia terricola TaxID=169427 RepID=A0ABU1LJU9_9BURK|nr:ATP-grasp domain-containing protein [Paraburkholderia terricola]MDR6406982.1 hypothetical protein [Paraburkholderia terricola]MDR6449400.1 hypothetical protein [Paraburkholderia terricola]MDR6479339.1 hypothetical protein [Paraburkholderia terricola]